MEEIYTEALRFYQTEENPSDQMGGRLWISEYCLNFMFLCGVDCKSFIKGSSGRKMVMENHVWVRYPGLSWIKLILEAGLTKPGLSLWAEHN